MVQEIALNKGKECKGSCRYETADPEAVVNNIYLSRKAFDNGKVPDTVYIMVSTEGPLTAQEAPAQAAPQQTHQPAPTQPRNQAKAAK